MSLRPLLTDEVVRLFGNPAQFIREDGSIDPSWEELTLGFATLPAPLPLSWARAQQVRRFRCHTRLTSIFTEALAAVHREPGLWATVNDFGGCYAWRAQRRSSALSRHCWGIAIDLDVADNPFGKTPKTDPRMVDVMESHGFAWGGNFKGQRKDGMHFEWARTEL